MRTEPYIALEIYNGTSGYSFIRLAHRAVRASSCRLFGFGQTEVLVAHGYTQLTCANSTLTSICWNAALSQEAQLMKLFTLQLSTYLLLVYITAGFI